MSLGRWIRNVLDYHSEVAVPGIGVFKKTHFPASYYAKEQVFLPPYDQIDLVEESDDTFQLVDYLQIHYEIDSADASVKLENALNDVFLKLNDGKTVYLNGLGQLENDRSVLKFSPLDTGKFGFGAVAELPLVTAAAKTHNDVPTDRASGRNWILVMGLILIAVIVGGIWFFYEPSGTTTRSEQMTTVVPPQEDPGQGNSPMASSDSLHASGVEPKETQTVVRTADAALTGDLLDPEAGLPETTFEIIIGTFKTIDEAASYMQRQKDQGYGHVRILATGSGSRLHKVSWGAYASQQDAQAVLREVQKRIERGAWIDRINR